MAKKPRKQPAQQGVSPLSGTAPPAEHQFKPGQSGNPSGRPAAGAAVKEWWNQMAEWPREKIEAVLTDKKAPVSKVAAARIWLYASSDERNNSGVPFGGNELERILDRTIGKPTSTVDLTTGGDSIEFTLKIGETPSGSD